MQIRTTKGVLPLADLAVTVVLEDRPTLLALLVRYEYAGELVRQDAFPLPKQTGDLVPTIEGDLPRASLTRTLELQEGPGERMVAEVFRRPNDPQILHRSVHMILKEPTVVAEAAAAALA